MERPPLPLSPEFFADPIARAVTLHLLTGAACVALVGAVVALSIYLASKEY